MIEWRRKLSPAERGARSRLAKHFFNSAFRTPSVRFGTGRISSASVAPSRNPSFEEREWFLLVLKLRRFRPVASLAARCRAPFGAIPRRTGSALAKARPPRRSSHMTTEEVDDVVRALTAVAENLEAGAAKQSMQEAFTQVGVYAGEIWVSATERPPRQRRSPG